jgi:hypothetical protein
MHSISIHSITEINITNGHLWTGDEEWAGVELLAGGRGRWVGGGVKVRGRVVPGSRLVDAGSGAAHALVSEVGGTWKPGHRCRGMGQCAQAPWSLGSQVTGAGVWASARRHRGRRPAVSGSYGEARVEAGVHWSTVEILFSTVLRRNSGFLGVHLHPPPWT